MPILFFVEGAFWVAVVALGGAPLLLLAALAGIASGALLLWASSFWAARPIAGASALFALALTVYQVYEAATLLESDLSTVGITSGAIFGVLAVVSIYLELATLSMGREGSTHES